MSTPAPTFERFSLSPKRRRKDRIARGVVVAATGVALVPLVLIVYYLLSKGLSSWSIKFFTTDPTGNTFFAASSIGGIKSAILGTIEMVALASAIAVPLGLGVAVWLVEYGKSSRFAHTVRFFIDVLTGVPSIMFGLFIYIALIVGTGTSYAAYKGAFALSLLMLPVVTRAAEVVLLLVPGSLRESALALGAPRWKVIFKDRAADRAARPADRHSAGDRARGRRDRATVVHRRGDDEDEVQPQRFHELAADADIHGRHISDHSRGKPCLGSGPDARRHDPPTQPLRAAAGAQEQPSMNADEPTMSAEKPTIYPGEPTMSADEPSPPSPTRRTR